MNWILKYNSDLKNIKPLMSNERYEHTIAVVEYILKLVQRFKLNENECILAGIYHDTCKEFEQDKMISVCSNDERVKTYPFWKTLHGIAASYYVKEKFNIADNKVLNAIANHVIPVQDVDEVSMALYLADKLEDTRDSYRIDNIEYYKKLSLTNLKQAYIETRNAYLDFEDKKKTN